MDTIACVFIVLAALCVLSMIGWVVGMWTNFKFGIVFMWIVLVFFFAMMAVIAVACGMEGY